MSAALLLAWWGTRTSQQGYLNASKAIEVAVDHTLTVAGIRTRDLDGSASTMDFATAVGDALLAASTPLHVARS